MASDNVPTEIEEKHFYYTSNININDKNATKDFIKSETERLDTDLDVPLHESINTKPYTEENLVATSKNNQNKQNCTHSFNNQTDDINKVYDHHKNVGHGLESDTEDNDNEVIPLVEEPIIIEPDPNIDDNLPSTVTLLRTPDGGKCYVIGTAHFSIESQNDVAKIIQAVQPHIVMVELCTDRISVLQMDEETILKEAKDLSFNKIRDVLKQHGVYKGLFYILLLNMSANLTKVLGLAPGGEFRRALQEAKKIPNCLVLMGDRPIKITFNRAISFLTWWQTIKLLWTLLTDRENISQSDIEKLKRRDLLEEMMNQLAGEYPALEEVFVQERDIFLTNSLQLACKPKIVGNNKRIPARVVGVVGIGHTPGIIENWGKIKPSQIIPIMSIPPPSFSSKVLKYTIKASLVGTIVYIAYKLIPAPIGVIKSLKSSVMGLIKVSSIKKQW